MNGAAPADLDTVRRDAESAGMPTGSTLLIVNVASQQLLAYRGRNLLGTYPVSTSKAGLGEQFDSNKTPRGLHRVAAWYGADAPIGCVLLDRKPTSKVLKELEWEHEGDYEILTRIMRLRGMEPGLNSGKGVDSYERLIYIHGTNQEQYCGRTPKSNGCIRMKNRDIVELFDATYEKETWCWIGELV